MYLFIYMYVLYICIYGKKNIYVLSNSFRRCLFQLHYSHKTNTTKTYTIETLNSFFYATLYTFNYHRE